MPQKKHNTVQLPEDENILDEITKLQAIMKDDLPEGVTIPKWAVIKTAVMEAIKRRLTT